MPEGRLERTRQNYWPTVVAMCGDMPSEILRRYANGEREIRVSPAVFLAYYEAVERRHGVMMRLELEDSTALMYKNMKVIRMK